MSEVIDHVGIRVSDLATSRRMYEAALAELGFAVLGEGEFEGDAYVLFGRGTSDDFALHAVGTEPGRDRVTTGAHTSRSGRRIPSASSDGMRRRSTTAAPTTGRPACTRSTAAATTLRSRSTRKATTSKLCSTHLSRP
jgi:catechol 2,3-dioxygenase-like lactoylglutathione lyase family enzyme